MITSLADLRPGDLGFGPIGGGAGVAVWLGQGILGKWSKEDRKVRHAYVVTQSGGFGTVPPQCVEAVAGGVRRADIGDRWGADWLYVRPAYTNHYQAREVARHAENMLKVPYNWLNYPALTAHHVRLPVPHLDRWIAEVDGRGYPRSVICSQHVDAALTLAGFQVFDDGRLPQDVWPSALYRRLLTLGPADVSQSVSDFERQH